MMWTIALEIIGAGTLTAWLMRLIEKVDMP